jgi:hypothetical protein
MPDPGGYPSEVPPPTRRRAGLRTFGVLVAVSTLLGGSWVWLQGRAGPMTLLPRCTATALENSFTLDPEQAGNAGTIAGIAVGRRLPARAATIAIATAIQESKLRNITYGDRDSVGLFQQRPSQGWGLREQILNPVYATNAFYDALVKIEGYQSMPITEVAQKVQRSAFPTAYADHEPEARIFASALAGHSEAALTCHLNKVGGLAAERAGANGLTARAAAVVAAAAEETGRGGRPVSGTDGRAVRFALSGGERDRLAWALAQWAVARADGLNIVSVQVDGRAWRRDTSEWTSVDGGTAVGSVLVSVA